MKYLKHFAVALALIIVLLGIRIYCHTSIPPHVVISNVKITVRSWGDPNYSLRYEFDIEKSGYFGNRWCEITQIVEGEEEQEQGHIGFSGGKGRSRITWLDLDGTFMNDGTPERIAKFQAEMQEQCNRNPTWAANLQEGSAYTFFEYTSLRKKKVSCTIRLTKEPESFSLPTNVRFWRLIKD